MEKNTGARVGVSPLLEHQKILGRKREKGHWVVHHVQGVQHQSYTCYLYIKPSLRLDLIGPRSSCHQSIVELN